MALIPDKYYKISEIAKELGINHRTVRRELQSANKPNGIPFLKVGEQKQVVILGQDIFNTWGSSTYKHQPTVDPNKDTSGSQS